MNIQIKKSDRYVLYCICIYQLDKVQAGVQNNHSTEKLILSQYNALKEFGIVDARLKNQKAVFLSGGTSAMLQNQINTLLEIDYPFFETFEEEDLYDVTTSYSVYIPEYIAKIKLPSYNSVLEEFKYIDFSNERNIFEVAKFVQHNYCPELTEYEIILKYITNDLNLI